MADSILDSTKNTLSIPSSYDVYDGQIIMHINSVFATLHQLGIGPDPSYFIADDTETWEDFIAETENINSVKTYMYLKVRMIFDPPTTSFAIAAMEKQIEELEFRLNLVREGTSWVDPDPEPVIVE
jgi:hypothetical protein